jgi:hypothetical protein
MPTAGYSGTPLAQKLGFKAGFTVHLAGAPVGFRKLLAPLPPKITFVTKPSATTDIIHVFVTSRKRLDDALRQFLRTMRSDATVWVSWPKKTSGVATDVTEDVIRAVALPLGFVDVKVCAIDDTWSGLKVVIRKELRRA